MTKKLRIYMIERCIDVVKKLFKYGFIGKKTAINWIWRVTIFFGKKEE